MEKPDENGFVNISWPSKKVPYGGIFHTRIVEPSEKHQQFVKLLLQESKLDIAQRRKSAFKLRQEDEKPAVRYHEDEDYGPERSLVRPRTSKRRSLSAIRESGVFEMEPYKPLRRGEDREHQKEVLAHIMQYGENPEQPPTRVPPRPPPKPKHVLPTAKDQWHQLMEQIRERAEWLAEMETLGQAEPHRDVIHEQIAQRMRALQALDCDVMSARSQGSGSGFSTMRSQEPTPKGSVRKPVHTSRSISSQASQKSAPSTAKSSDSKQCKAKPSTKKAVPVKDEHISALNQGRFTPLEYTPRRRV